VDNLIVAFTVLTNDGQRAIVDDALAMFKGAVHKRAAAGELDRAAFRPGTKASP
jgi:hypothetical protein